jgi:hypothetical protein
VTKRNPMLHEILGHDFPDYEFQAYPMWVTKPDGTKVIVQNEAEGKALGVEPPAPPKTEAQIRAELEAQIRAELKAEMDEELSGPASKVLPAKVVVK